MCGLDRNAFAWSGGYICQWKYCVYQANIFILKPVKDISASWDLCCHQDIFILELKVWRCQRPGYRCLCWNFFENSKQQWMAYRNPSENLFKTCSQESLRSPGNLSKTKNMTWSPQSQTSSSGRPSVATFLKTTFTFQSSSYNHLLQFHFNASSPQCVEHLHVHWGHCAVVEHLWTTTLTKKIRRQQH